MKQFFNALLFGCLFINVANAQTQIASVPIDASIVVKYSGDNFGKHLPVKKLEGYDFIREDLFKVLRLDTLTSLQQTGIALEKDVYQYLITQDSSVSYVTLMQLNSTTQFQQFLKSAYKNSRGTTAKNGYTFLILNDEMYAAWNNTSALIVSSSYKFRKSYWASEYYNVKVDTAEITYADTSVSIIADEPPMVEDEAIVKKDSKKSNKKSTTKKKKSKKPDPKDKKKSAEEKLEELVIYDEEVQKDSSEIKRELWDQQQDMIAKNKQQLAAENIATATFTGTIQSIQSNESYRKQVDPGAHIRVCLNSGNLLSQYVNYFGRSIYALYGMRQE
ncbi:MAG: hypothetical protein EOO18_14175, partial [Chryseobacterium sp.]